MPRGANADMRLFGLGLLMMLGLGALILRLWELQVMRGELYASKIGTSSLVTVRIPSVRGEIRDRNGIPLVQNRASYNVDFYLPDMVRGFRQRSLAKLPLISERQTVKGMLQEVNRADIVKVVNTGVVPRLQDLDLARDYNAKHLKTHYKNDELVPFTYIEDIDFPTIARFSEHDVGLPGVEISVKPVRQYLYGAFAAHLLGYVGMPRDISQLPDVGQFKFYQPDVEGKNQIEQAMDPYLRGKPGTRTMKRNVKGAFDGEVRIDPPTPGANVYLTLDAKKQYIVEQALRHPSLGRAGAVVIDPNNGDILAMASIPSFDPNIFIPSVSTQAWGGLMKDPAVPLVNRAVSGFPPGSTFKIVTSLAGLSRGLANKTENCVGSVEYGGRWFACWIAEKGGSHGTLGLSDAIKVSCNAFFYQFGNAAGGEALERIGGVLGIGRKYDLGLTDEKAGIMPGPNWMKANYPNQNWTSAQTANTSIGQGYVLASPLQMAMAYTAVANGGIAYEPRLIRTVLNPDGTPTLDENGQVAVPDQPKIRLDLRNEIPPDQIEIVRRGLWNVVNETGGPGGGGTGKQGRVKGTVVAGKTGTAQSTDRGQKEHIAWFCCFAPYDKPKYVVVVMVQGGEHGGSVAAPVAAKILEECLAVDQGTLKVDLKPLAPARNDNPFQMITALPPYGDDPSLINTAPVEDEESSDSAEASNQKPEMGQGNARPDIKPEADLQGTVRKKTSAARPADSIQPEPNAAPGETARKAAPGRQKEAPRALPARPSEPQRRNLLDRFFNRNP